MTIPLVCSTPLPLVIVWGGAKGPLGFYGAVLAAETLAAPLLAVRGLRWIGTDDDAAVWMALGSLGVTALFAAPLAVLFLVGSALVGQG